MDGRIRLATKEDALNIHSLHTRSVRGLCSADYPPEVIEGWLEGRSPEGYKGIAKNEMYVYEEQGKIVGWSHVHPEGIAGLFVDVDHARKGVGRALFEHGLGMIRQHTSEHLEFSATVTAVPFYEKCGCKRLYTSSVRKNAVDIAIVRMALPEANEQETEDDAVNRASPRE